MLLRRQVVISVSGLCEVGSLAVSSSTFGAIGGIGLIPEGGDM